GRVRHALRPAAGPANHPVPRVGRLNNVRRAAVFGAVLLLAACAARPSFKTRTSGRDVALSIVTWNVNKGRGELARFTDDLVAGRLTPTPVRDFMIFLQETVEGNENDAATRAG